MKIENYPLTVWQRDPSKPGGYRQIYPTTYAPGRDGFAAASHLAKMLCLYPDDWQSTPGNQGRPRIIIRNEKKI